MHYDTEQQLELLDDNDWIDEVPLAVSFAKIGNFRYDPLLRAAIEMERLARDHGILEEDYD